MDENKMFEWLAKSFVGAAFRWAMNKTVTALFLKLAEHGTVKFNSLLRDYVCKHQMLYTAYSVEMGKTHQELHGIVVELEVMGGPAISPEDSKKLLTSLKSLVRCYSSNMLESGKITCDFYKKYFDLTLAKKATHSRACIKLATTEKDIIDISRTSGKSYPPYPAKENTGFLYIEDQGKEFVCQDIPKAVKEGEYENSRINIKTVQKTYTPPPTSKAEDTWSSYWHDSSVVESDCYKSTLIVPMTIGSADATKPYIQDLVNQLSKEGGNEKCVFGYICIDSPKTDTINDLDISVGWILADLMSLYVIDQMIYSDYSDVFRKARDMLLEDDRAEFEKYNPA